MDIFLQKKFFVITIIILVLLNLTLMLFFMLRNTGSQQEPAQVQNQIQKENKNDVAQVLEKELDLKPEQVEQIRKLRSDFFEKEKKLTKNIRSARDSMNLIMFNKSTNDEQIKLLAKKIADNEYTMELLRYEQAKQFKSICSPEQLKKFENLVRGIRDYFKPDDNQRMDNRPPRRDNQSTETEKRRQRRDDNDRQRDNRPPRDKDTRPPRGDNPPTDRDNRPPRGDNPPDRYRNEGNGREQACLFPTN